MSQCRENRILSDRRSMKRASNFTTKHETIPHFHALRGESKNWRSCATGTMRHKQKSREALSASRLFMWDWGGGDLLFHAIAHAVPSALRSLTTVFGMGTGVASSLESPPQKGGSNRGLYRCKAVPVSRVALKERMVKPLGPLGSVSSMHCCTSTPDLSTSWSTRGLLAGFTLREFSSWGGLPA